MISKWRLITQVSIFFLIIVVTYFNHYENQKVKYGGQMIINSSFVLRTIDKAVGHLENRTELVTFLQGDVWAAQIGGLKLTDPLAFVGNLARTKEFYGILFFAALIPIIATILLGKFFCSWICPMGLLFELNDHLRKFLIKVGVPLFNLKISHRVKYYVLGFGLLTGIFFGVHYFLIIYPPKLVSGEIYFLITRSSVSAGIIFLFILLAVELILAPRMWCRSLCPGGAVYTLLNKIRLVRIKNDIKNCIDCGICDRLCPYELVPSKSHISADCDHCSICIDKCPVDTLSFIVGKEQDQSIGEGKQTVPKKKKKVHVPLMILVLALLLFAPAHVYAHHIRGLPHYGYSDNYPQIPTYEENRIVDDWDITFSFIKIFETTHCDLAIYMKNRKDGRPFNGKMIFKVFGERESPDAVHSYQAELDPTNTFRVGWVYEEDGIYILRIRFQDGEREYAEDFRMQMGDVGFNMLWIVLPGSVVLILILLVVGKRIKEQRAVKA